MFDWLGTKRAGDTSPCQAWALLAPGEAGGNQGQIPVVYSRSLCQLLRKSEQMPPTGISRKDVHVMSVGMDLSFCPVKRWVLKVKHRSGLCFRHADAAHLPFLSNTRGRRRQQCEDFYHSCLYLAFTVERTGTSDSKMSCDAGGAQFTLYPPNTLSACVEKKKKLIFSVNQKWKLQQASLKITFGSSHAFT